jgi:hypothetical protein
MFGDKIKCNEVGTSSSYSKVAKPVMYSQSVRSLSSEALFAWLISYG